jgi:hypothetical protein
MKIVFPLLTLCIIPHLSSGQIVRRPAPVLRMKVSDELLRNGSQYPVEIKRSLRTLPLYQFAGMSVVKSRTGWVRTGNIQGRFPWLVDIELVNQRAIFRQQMSYEMHIRQPGDLYADVARQAYKETNNSISINDINITALVRYEEYWGAEFFGLAVENKTWTLNMSLRYNRKIENYYAFDGQLYNGETSIRIIPVREFNESNSVPDKGKGKGRFPKSLNIPVPYVGYEFWMNDKVLAAVQCSFFDALLMDAPRGQRGTDYWEQIVIFSHDLEPSVKAAIAGTIPCLLFATKAVHNVGEMRE